MPSVTYDRVTSVSVSEVDGVAESMTRTVLVTGVGDGNYTALQTALDLVYPCGTISSEYPMLAIQSRQARLVPGETGKIEIELNYARKTEVLSAGWTLRGSSSVKQVQSSENGWGIRESVSYTYPETYAYDTDLQGETVSQSAEFSAMVPQTEIEISGIEETDTPHILSHTWTGAINETQWLGGPAGFWICTGVTFEPLDTTHNPMRWVFRYSFQIDDKGWSPVVTFIDPNTGKPPSDLVAGTGIKTIAWYKTIDYNSKFKVL